MELSFSFIVPVYNRPNEIRELLDSLSLQTYQKGFEVVIVEDGSTISSEQEVRAFVNALAISYYKKDNSGPGDSRNYGMQRAKGNYFIVLDSDCILPSNYLTEVEQSLQKDFVHCYGGPDAAHESFTIVQKAINYAMTSFLTTGGIRGGKRAVDKFQPRSFNMGLSKEVFDKVGGYGKIHPGEDPDLTIRIWNKGYRTKLISEAFVYHKRRIDWKKFYTQVNKFGMVRPILNKWHPATRKFTYWFPTLFSLGLIFAVILVGLGVYLPLFCYVLYFSILWLDALLKTKNILVSILAIFATGVQFIGYGYGFLKSTICLAVSSKKANEIFPKLFFK
ncbi:Glycosyl transferase family 2 [Maribacter sedimenticola]|uniref:Glycosyl transferase family 2 n=1 Tax=Maribacter sedimenticola TaxID=228956 RepID=A0ABY1SGP3_9FLAO|nr:glycosyltransferase [Maribacter sedimenticola]SNR44158.1 Glycosyl transferase family 2 [Maribacter sedimenticola]